MDLQTTQAQLGTGTYIVFGDMDSSDVFTPASDDGSDDIFAELFHIKPPSLEGGKVDVTHLLSVSYRQSLAKELMDVGDMECDGNFIPSIDPADYVNVPQGMGIVYPDKVVWAFTGSLSTYNADVPLEDKMTVAMKFVVYNGFQVGTLAT
jgi:hypothetical protein